MIKNIILFFKRKYIVFRIVRNYKKIFNNDFSFDINKNKKSLLKFIKNSYPNSKVNINYNKENNSFDCYVEGVIVINEDRF